MSSFPWHVLRRLRRTKTFFISAVIWLTGIDFLFMQCIATALFRNISVIICILGDILYERNLNLSILDSILLSHVFNIDGKCPWWTFSSEQCVKDGNIVSLFLDRFAIHDSRIGRILPQSTHFQWPDITFNVQQKIVFSPERADCQWNCVETAAWWTGFRKF